MPVEANRSPDDLTAHDCVQYRLDGALFPWPFMREGTRRKIAVHGAVTVNSSELALRAAIDGLGLAFINDSVAAPFLRSGQLMAVLPDWSPSFDGYYLIYRGRRQVPLPLRALIDMLRAQRLAARCPTPRLVSRERAGAIVAGPGDYCTG